MKSYKAERITVPAGHVLPKGNAVERAFDLTVEYGARWHPDWEEPRICVNAFRFMYHGDALVFSGQSATAFPLPKGAALLAAFHGDKLTADKPITRAMVEQYGLEIPTKPEPLAAFVAKPALGTIQ